MDRNKIKRVHVVFKTHLDVGFTDLAETVLSQYRQHHIPHSIRLAEELNTEKEKKFIWTVGSYLIDDYLRHGTPEEVARMEKAIARGDICWHGLYCTTHTELLDRDLLDFNLSVSDELDRRFHKETIAAKMTDVPGHTRAMIELLARHGIRYIHFGVNASSMVPDVPLSFVWKSGENDVIVQYSFTYGAPCYVEGMDEVLEFAHTGDNMGPQSGEAIEKEMARIQALYPNAVVEASTLDNYARSVLPYKDTLPVIEEEIGDTWIHGTGTDPLKVMRYRTLVQLKNKWEAEGRWTKETAGYHDFMSNLLLVAEHTWGLDFKKYLADFKNWRKADFQAARAADRTRLEDIPASKSYIRDMILDDLQKYRGGRFDGSYSFFESSHEEKRQYITKAVAALPQDLRNEAEAAMRQLEESRPAGYENAAAVSPYEKLHFGRWTVAFGGAGELVYLARDGRPWVQNGCFGRLVYTTYSAAECMNNFYHYNRDLDETMCWCEPDFSKPGMETVPELEHRDYLFGAQVKTTGNRVLVTLRGDTRAVQEYGCPADACIEYVFDDVIRCRLHWENKDANKMVEALWFDADFDVENVSRWKMQKLGQLVSPLEVVRGGNRRHHCVEAMQYAGADGKLCVKNIHSPLVSMGGHWLYGDYRDMPDMNKGFSYCLFNNKWGTNFKMWCEDSCTFDYEISTETF